MKSLRLNRNSQPSAFILRPRQIDALSRVYLDFLAFVDEGGHLHDQAGFGLRSFGDAGCGCALQSRFSFNHLEYYGLRQLNAHGLAIEEFDLDFQILDQVINGAAQNILGEMRLLVVRRVHEVVVVAVGIEELHVDFVDVHLLDGVGRAETVFEHGAGTQVAQFGLNEGPQVAGRAVFDGKNRVQIIVVLDDHAGTQLGGRDRHRLEPSPSFKARWLSWRKAGRPHFPLQLRIKALFYTQLAGKETFPGLRSS